MDPKEPRPAETPTPPAPRRRFRLEKLEERIAPKRGNATHKCATDSCDTVSGSINPSTY